MHAKIEAVTKRIEAKGFTIEQVLGKRGFCETIPAGRSSSVSVERHSYIIEFSKDNGMIFGRVDADLTTNTFNKRNPNDRTKTPYTESVRFTADEETKKLLEWE